MVGTMGGAPASPALGITLIPRRVICRVRYLRYLGAGSPCGPARRRISPRRVRETGSAEPAASPAAPAWRPPAARDRSAPPVTYLSSSELLQFCVFLTGAKGSSVSRSPDRSASQSGVLFNLSIFGDQSIIFLERDASRRRMRLHVLQLDSVGLVGRRQGNFRVTRLSGSRGKRLRQKYRGERREGRCVQTQAAPAQRASAIRFASINACRIKLAVVWRIHSGDGYVAVRDGPRVLVLSWVAVLAH